MVLHKTKLQIQNKLFTLPDDNIDTTTIKVGVSPSIGNTSVSIYSNVTDILDITSSTSEVYFLQEGQSGKYEIYFGNDVVGKKLPDGGVVNVTYLLTNGDAANKANNFIATSTLTDSLAESLSISQLLQFLLHLVAQKENL
jgi:hypothetical protein